MILQFNDFFFVIGFATVTPVYFYPPHTRLEASGGDDLAVIEIGGDVDLEIPALVRRAEKVNFAMYLFKLGREQQFHL